MEGKVELTIDRYEELRKIEREGLARIKELEAGRVEVKTSCTITLNGMFSGSVFISSDEAIKEISKEIEKKEKELSEVRKNHREIVFALQKATFFDRLKYAFTGDFEVPE